MTGTTALLAPNPEGTVGLLLLTMLAIAVSAHYEFNPQRVLAHMNTLLDPIKPIKLTKMDNMVQWKAQRHYNEIALDIENPAAIGKNCDEGPAMTIPDGTLHCLYRVTFTIEKDNYGNRYLELDLFFRLNSDADVISRVHSEVFKPSPNQNDDRWKLLRVQPVTKSQLEEAKGGETFHGPVRWVKELLSKGLYAGYISADGKENDLIEYITHPVVILSNIVEEIVSFR